MTIFPAVLFLLFLLAVVSGAVLGILMHVKDDEWRPIDTAPKDGRGILVRDHTFIRIVTWRRAWVTAQDLKPIAFEPTHWRALPGWAS